MDVRKILDKCTQGLKGIELYELDEVLKNGLIFVNLKVYIIPCFYKALNSFLIFLLQI